MQYKYKKRKHPKLVPLRWLLDEQSLKVLERVRAESFG